MGQAMQHRLLIEAAPPLVAKPSLQKAPNSVAL
jgi:hypothetical protein